jgi:hypothetical protein
MTQLLKILPLLTVLVAAPGFAAEPNPHAGHHPTTAADVAQPAPPAAEADAKSVMHACKMMDGKKVAGPAAMAGKGPEGKMMMDPKDMHCMPAPAAATDANAAHDHEHPAAAPK